MTETARLRIRPFERADLPIIHRILEQTFGDGSRVSDPAALEQRGSWLEWNVLSSHWFPRLEQHPYGERAVVLRERDELVGAVGYVPCLDRFEQIAGLRVGPEDRGHKTAEVGLFWVIDPAHQRQGYATEAARSLVDAGFSRHDLSRVVATTEHDNHASIAVMRKLGMRIERNPGPDSPWLQVVGVLDHPGMHKRPS